MKSSRVCWRPGPSGFSRNKYTHQASITPRVNPSLWRRCSLVGIALLVHLLLRLVALLKAHGIDNDINSGHDDGDRAYGLALRDLRLWGGRRLDIETLQAWITAERSR